MKKIYSILSLTLISVTTIAQVYVYNAQGLISELDEYPDSIITIPPYRTPLPASEEGALSGVFSVSKNRKVRFSQGNLQYRIADGVWQFAENQYDTLGGNIENQVIDQFGFGTSGWSESGAVAYMPTDTSMSEESYYGQIGGLLYEPATGYLRHRDWGVHNPIANGGNEAGLWRTLTSAEWGYLTLKRWTPYAIAIVNGVWGIVLLPDNWNEEPTQKMRPCYFDKDWKQHTQYSEEEIEQILLAFDNDTLSARSLIGIYFYSFIPGYGYEMTEDGYESTGVLPLEDFNITPDEWLSYESKGCVFLPFNKSRNHPNNTTRGRTEDYYCVYWSQYPSYGNQAMEYRYTGNSNNPYPFYMRSGTSASFCPLFVGGCVRLVQDY